MTVYDSHRPQDCPEQITAANGVTVLNRFRVDAVIYARTRAEALARLENGAVYLDAARMLRDEDAKPAVHDIHGGPGTSCWCGYRGGPEQ